MNNQFASYENRNTDPSLSPADRAHQALNCGWSCDWNEATQEYNPYPKGSVDFRIYSDTLDKLNDYMHKMDW